MSATRAIGTAVVRFLSDTEGFERGLVNMSKKTQTLSERLSRTGERMQGMGKRLSLGVTAPLVAAGAVVGKFGLDFDKAMTESTAIMGNLSDAMRNDLKNAALDVSKTTTFSARQAAESFFFLASAGLDAEQSIAALPKVAQFAQAGAFDMATATDLLTDAQSALGLSVDDTSKNMQNMARVSDVLVGANTLANAKVQEFSESLTNKAGAAMRRLNIPLEEGVAVLAAFADQGVKGAEAGTAFTIVTRELERRARENVETWKDFGVAVFDANGNLRPLGDIVVDLENKLAGMTVKQQNATLAMLGFESESLAFIGALLGAGDEINKFSDKLNEMGGITAEVADKQLEGLTAQLILLKDRILAEVIRTFEDMRGTIESKLIPAVEKAVGVFTGLLRLFANLPQPVQEFALGAAALAAALGPVLLVGGTLVKTFSGIIGAIGSIGAGFASASAAVTAAGGILPALKGLGVAAVATTGAVGALTVGLAALGGITLVKLSSEIAKTIDAHRALEDAQRSAVDTGMALIANLRQRVELTEKENEKLNEILEMEDGFEKRAQLNLFLADTQEKAARRRIAALQEEAVTRQQITQVIVTSRERELNFELAAIAVVNDLNEREIAMLKRGVEIKEILNAREAASERNTAQDTAVSREARISQMERFIEAVQKERDEIAQARAELLEGVREQGELSADAASQLRDLNTRSQALAGATTTALIEETRERVSTLRTEAFEHEKTEQAIAESAESQAGAVEQSTNRQVRANTASGRSAAELRKRVFQEAPQIAEAYERAGAKQRLALDGMIGSLNATDASVAETVDSINRTWERTDIAGPLKREATKAQAVIDTSARDTQRGLNFLGRVWDDFFRWIGGKLDSLRQKMGILNPAQRASPSIVDEVDRGTRALVETWQRRALQLFEIFEKTFQEERKLLEPFQGTISTKRVLGPGGNIDFGESRFISAPEGLDFRQFIAMEQARERIENLIDKIVEAGGTVGPALQQVLAGLRIGAPVSTAQIENDLNTVTGGGGRDPSRTLTALFNAVTPDRGGVRARQLGIGPATAFEARRSNDGAENGASRSGSTDTDGNVNLNFNAVVRSDADLEALIEKVVRRIRMQARLA